MAIRGGIPREHLWQALRRNPDYRQLCVRLREGIPPLVEALQGAASEDARVCLRVLPAMYVSMCGGPPAPGTITDLRAVEMFLQPGRFRSPACELLADVTWPWYEVNRRLAVRYLPVYDPGLDKINCQYWDHGAVRPLSMTYIDTPVHIAGVGVDLRFAAEEIEPAIRSFIKQARKARALTGRQTALFPLGLKDADWLRCWRVYDLRKPQGGGPLSYEKIARMLRLPGPRTVKGPPDTAIDGLRRDMYHASRLVEAVFPSAGQPLAAPSR